MNEISRSRKQITSIQLACQHIIRKQTNARGAQLQGTWEGRKLTEAFRVVSTTTKQARKMATVDC